MQKKEKGGGSQLYHVAKATRGEGCGVEATKNILLI